MTSKAQQALQLELEARKKERRTVSCTEREQQADRKRELARHKAKAKHRGR
jgi:hypothetical protein